ncbi:MAG: hypothetical protein QGD92_00425 [Gammaproteobacteria bacterium]|nr:hypothetical protein [Gammaproteobacteria bacterium]
MSGKWKEVVRLRFKGERFRDHALDLSALGGLSQFQKMVAETAKVLWRAAHPDQGRLPRHFEQRTRLCLRTIEEGSATVPLEVFMEDEVIQDLFGPVEPVEVNEAIGLAYEVFEALEKGDTLPDRLPRSLIPEYAKFSQTLGPEEEIEISTPEREPVHLTLVSKQRLTEYVEKTYEADVDVTGQVLEADVKRQRFQLWLDDTTKATVSFTEQQEDEVTTALKEHQHRNMQVKGWGQYSSAGKLLQVTRIDEMKLFPVGESLFDMTATPIEEVLQDLAKKIPQEDWDAFPADLTDDLDHYLYGTPRK